MNDTEIDKAIEQRLVDVQGALQVVAGEMEKLQQKSMTVKSILTRWFPVSRKRIRESEENLLKLSYSVLQVQTQILQLIKDFRTHLKGQDVPTESKENKEDCMYG